MRGFDLYQRRLIVMKQPDATLNCVGGVRLPLFSPGEMPREIAYPLRSGIPCYG